MHHRRPRRGTLIAATTLTTIGLTLALTPAAHAMPPTGPGSQQTSDGVTIDDSDARPGGTIKVTYTNLKKDDMEGFNCKLLISPWGKSYNGTAGNWSMAQLNWSNPDGKYVGGQTNGNGVTYTAVKQVGSSGQNQGADTVAFDLNAKEFDWSKGTFTGTFTLPSDLSPDVYYMQCLGGAKFAQGTSYFVAAGKPQVTTGASTVKAGDSLDVSLSNFASGTRIGVTPDSKFKIVSLGDYPAVDLSIDGKKVASAPVDYKDGKTTGKARIQLPADLAAGKHTLTATQGFRTATVDFTVGDVQPETTTEPTKPSEPTKPAEPSKPSESGGILGLIFGTIFDFFRMILSLPLAIIGTIGKLITG